MLEAILSVVAIAFIGALTVPLMMLTLARLGYFEPIHVFVFGRHWNFAPKVRRVDAFSRAATGIMSPAIVSVSLPAVIVVGHLQLVAPMDRPQPCLVTAEIMSWTDSTIISINVAGDSVRENND
jgi:hypothetical protein